MTEPEGPNYSIAEQLMFTTVRIETRDGDGGSGVGTGFVFEIDVAADRKALFLVTNKHVIAGAQTGILSFTIARDGAPSIGRRYDLRVDDFETGFTGHDDPDVDVAAMPFVPIIEHLGRQGVQIFYRSIPASMIPSKEQIDELDALEDVVFIGYPNGIWDAENNLPVIRRGITATPVSIDFQREPKFLVDASVFPGSSGSPVFLYNIGSYSRKGGGTVIGNRVLFLGVVAAVFFREDSGEIRMADVPTASVPIAVVKQMINLGIVYKASAIHDVAKKIVAGA